MAEFYERQKKWLSAALYYRRITAQYAETPWASEAVTRVTELERLGHIK